MIPWDRLSAFSVYAEDEELLEAPRN